MLNRLSGMPLWLGIAGVVIALDQMTKAWISAALAPGESIRVAPFFDLVFVYNRGAAFSFLSNAGGWQKWFFVILALAISAWIVANLRRHPARTVQALALALILGGALGNVLDRLRLDAVADFLSFHLGSHYWPAFNVADSAISIGIVLLVWRQLLPHEH